MNLPGTKTRSSNTYYFSILDGKFARKCKEMDEGAKKRINKNDQVVYEILVDAIEGTLLDCHLHDSDYGKQLNVEICPAEGYKYIITIPVQSRYFGTFVERLPNLKSGETIELAPYSFEDDKKRKQQGVTVKKNAAKIPSAFKLKEGDQWISVGGFPAFPENWKELKEKDHKIYFLEVGDFLEEAVNKWRLENAPNYHENGGEQKSDLPWDKEAQTSDKPPF